MSGYTTVTGESRGAAYVIILTAPAGGAYLTYAGMQQFIAALREAQDSGAVVLHVQAEGPDFCLGRLQGEQVEGVTRRDGLNLILEANDALAAFTGVSIAEVHGRAYGFGAGLAVQCDLTVADADARFAFDEVDHGLAPLVVAEYLPRYLGDKRAQTMVLTGEELTAATAESWGMVTHLSAAGGAAQEADRLVERLTGLEPGALRLLTRYHNAVVAGELDSPREAAVEQLDRWLTDGRPANPACGDRGRKIRRAGR